MLLDNIVKKLANKTIIHSEDKDIILAKEKLTEGELLELDKETLREHKVKNIKPFDYQEIMSRQAIAKLKEYNKVYFAMEERTGKTLAAILACENLFNRILVITTKKAKNGWIETFVKYDIKKEYSVTNYHNAQKALDIYDCIILDEAHNYISSFPKRSSIWENVFSKTQKVENLIYISATPSPQGHQQLFNQLTLHTKDRWRAFRNYYSWYKEYALRDKNGNTETKYIPGIGKHVDTYAKVQTERIETETEHLFLTKTRGEAGFRQEPEDVLHYIELSEGIKYAYNKFLKDKLLIFDVNDTEYIITAKTKSRERHVAYMFEGGTLKLDDGNELELNNTEKIDYIKQKWGDTKDMVIMYTYIAEALKLKKHFKNAEILSATKFAEGVDLYHKEHIIVYSQNFSTAKYTQRRARQTHKTKRTKQIKVNYLLVKNGISEQAYKTVAVNRKNFVDTYFKRIAL